jgi:penicillin amidase
MASWWKQTLTTAASLTGFAAGTYNLLTRKPLPQRSGKLHLQGLHEPIKIITDHYGIPHIYAHNEDDLYFAQGYIHAQERLWQMEMNRRLGAGRLAEIVGPLALETDRFCRRLGLHRAADAATKQLSAHTCRILEAYVNGINTFIQTNPHKLPVEFTLLHIKAEPWRIRDVLQWGKIQGWSLSGNWETELVRARLVAKLGPEKAAQLEPGYDPKHPLIMPSGVAYQGINLGMLEQYENIKELSGFGPLGGSNNWVIDGTMTASGLPLLCNDPHLGQHAPSIYFECHLIAGDINVTGASFPGGPGIVIGHNQHIAWGITNAISDVGDLYIEKFNPDNPHQYEFQGQWENAQVLREEIRVKGQDDPIIEEVLITRHGPILTSFAHNGQQEKDLPLAIRWTGLEQHNIAEAVQKINIAKNWEEFRDGLRHWDVPAQNFVYADRQGNIGYVMAGAIPIRARGQALVPSPGWSGEYEWTGLIPFEELPQTYNPEQHFIITANNRVVDDDYPYYITHEWLNGYRAQRIHDILTSKTTFTIEDMITLQADQYSLPATEIVPHILKLTPKNPLQQAAQEILRTWDYIMTPSSIGATLYTVFLRKLAHLIFDLAIGDDTTLSSQYMGTGTTIFSIMNGYAGRSTPLLIRLLKEQDDNWFADSIFTNGPKTWQVALERTFEATLDELSEQLGSNILRWQYGAIHKMRCVHPLGMIKPLEKFFNRGPYPIGGDIDTVNVAASADNAPEEVLSVPAYRQIVDLSNLENSRAIHMPGQSGHPASKHFDDFISLWRENNYHPVYFDADTIETAAAAVLHLLPKRT